MSINTKGYINVTFKAHKEGDQFVSECIELGVASCGDTLEEAFENIKDAVLLYLNTLEKEGERERVFSERGIQIIPGEPPSPEPEIPVNVRPHEYVSSETVQYPLSA
jgi:predicted RNase H-like HicB family nuclease